MERFPKKRKYDGEVGYAKKQRQQENVLSEAPQGIVLGNLQLHQCGERGGGVIELKSCMHSAVAFNYSD